MYKVMVVDDEYMIRQGIINLINWEELSCKVVKEAKNGNEAYEYLLNDDVDILICDIRMPGKDGLELCRMIQENNWKIKIVLLTAYSDFQYAQQAVRFNVFDYIVKTNYIEKLPQTVEKLIISLETEREKEFELEYIRSKLDDSMLMLQEKYLMDMIHGAIQERSVAEARAEWCSLNLHPYYVLSFVFYTEGIKKINRIQKEKTNRAIKNFINLSYQDYKMITSFLKDTEFVSVIFDSNSRKSESGEDFFLKRLKMVSEKFQKSIEETLGITVNVCIGLKNEDIMTLRDSYEKVRSLNRKERFLAHHGVYTQSLTKNRETVTDREFLSIVMMIQEKIEREAYVQAESICDRFVEIAENGKCDVDEIICSAINICLVCYRKLEQKSIVLSEFMDKHLPVYQDLSSCEDVYQLKDLLQQMIHLTAEILNNSEVLYDGLVKKCMIYIRNHYHEKINIGIIAEKLHVNKSYMGTIFKKETGLSIVEVITKYRMNKAVELMQKTDYKLFEISEMVGFDDPAYFSNVFTKYMGISPRSYRESNLK